MKTNQFDDEGRRQNMKPTLQSDLLSPDDKAFLKEAHVEVADDAASVEKLSSLDGQYCEAHGQIFGPQHRCAVILFELGTYRPRGHKK